MTLAIVSVLLAFGSSAFFLSLIDKLPMPWFLALFASLFVESLWHLFCFLVVLLPASLVFNMWLYIPDVAISNTFLVTPTGSFGLGVGEWLYNGTAFSVITAANPLPIAPANVSGAASPFLMQFPFDVSAYAQLVGFFLGLFVLSYGVGAIYRLFVPSRFS